MGYFNYFIKCIIRKFVNIFFKPKVMFITFITIFMLYLFCGSVRAETYWTEQSVANVLVNLLDIALNTDAQLDDLDALVNTSGVINDNINYISGQLVSLKNELISICTELESLHVDTNNYLELINGNINYLARQLEKINTEISNIYNSLEENHQELLTELDKDNHAVLAELNMIRDSINGTEEEQDSFIDNGLIYCVDQSSNLYRLKSISLNYESNYTYTIKIYYKQGDSFSYTARMYATDDVIPNNYNSSDYWFNFKSMGTVPSGTSTSSFTYIVPSTKPKYIYFSAGSHIEKIEVFRSIKGIADSLNDNNTLQQESNQLQQEQNDFLSKPSEDSDVSVDSFNNVDSNDITSSGLSGVFNTIYNSITSWNSKDIVLPIPKVNRSITIPANYTENMMLKIGGGVLVNIIHTVYYFIVARFIIYSITGIINSIKSGSILETDTKNNITTDML